MGAAGPWSPSDLKNSGGGETRVEKRLKEREGSHVWGLEERSDHRWIEGRGGGEGKSEGGQEEV